MTEKKRPGDADQLHEISESTQIVDTKLFQQVRQSQKTVQAYLIVLTGPEVGKMYKIDSDELTLGRASNVELRINDSGISRNHAKVSRDEMGAIFIEDLSSANGTHLNGDKLMLRQQLRDGDKITLGSTTILKFTYHDTLDEDFQRKMVEAALRDGLTGAFNKKYFMDHLSSEFSFALRHGTPLSLVMFDGDHFKRVNDTFGHLAGDAVLVHLARIAQESVRTEDLFARYGGEEFAVICRGISMHQAAHLGERLRRGVEQQIIEYHGKPIPITISVGVSGIPELGLRTPEELIEAADAALYAAKNHGRNCVMLATPPVR
jgi:two-component system, cell cycle response regulator